MERLTMQHVSNQNLNNEYSQMRTPTISLTLDILGFLRHDDNIK